MPKRGQASPDDGDALALTFAQVVAPAEKEECDEDNEFGGNGGFNGPASTIPNPRHYFSFTIETCHNLLRIPRVSINVGEKGPSKCSTNLHPLRSCSACF